MLWAKIIAFFETFTHAVSIRSNSAPAKISASFPETLTIYHQNIDLSFPFVLDLCNLYTGLSGNLNISKNNASEESQHNNEENVHEINFKLALFMI